VFDAITDRLTDGPIAYLLAFISAIGDAILPLFPSETILTTGGVLASRGELSWPLLALSGGVGAVVGDNAMYWLGRRAGEPLVRKYVLRGDKGEQRLEWAKRAVQRHGTTMIMVGRFIPGGRTAATLAAGITEMPYRRFVVIDLIAVTLWALYTTLIGYLGGSAFSDSLLAPIAAALSVGVVASLAIELFRRIQAKRGKDLLGDELRT
jgi:membrane-associated protein